MISTVAVFVGVALVGGLIWDATRLAIRFAADTSRTRRGAVRAILVLVPLPGRERFLEEALSSAGANSVADLRLNELLASAMETRRVLRTSPHQLADAAAARELTENELLGRPEEAVRIDLGAIRNMVEDRTVLVTGAGGSVGSELCRQLKDLGVEQLFMLDRDENALHNIETQLTQGRNDTRFKSIVADVRDEPRVTEVFDQRSIDIVFHCSSLKQLSFLERFPEEGIKTNVYGARNVLESSVAAGVEVFCNISTDKAADPENVLGATKLLTERLTTNAASRTGRNYFSIRFGNVLGSSGSVLPTFRSLILAGSPLRVTDPEVARDFLTVDSTARLILQASAVAEAGEILAIRMGKPIKVVDIARRLIDHCGRHVEIVFDGLRPGEKLSETSIGRNESGEIRGHPLITHIEGSGSLDITREVSLSENNHSHVLNAIATLTS